MKIKRWLLELSVKYDKQLDWLETQFDNIFVLQRPYYAVRGFIYRMRRGIKFFKYGYKSNTYSHESLVELMALQLGSMSESFKKDIWSNSFTQAEQTHICASILSNFYMVPPHWYDYYETEIYNQLCYSKLGFPLNPDFPETKKIVYIDEETQTKKYKHLTPDGEQFNFNYDAASYWERGNEYSKKEIYEIERDALEYVEKVKSADLRVALHIMGSNMFKWWS